MNQEQFKQSSYQLEGHLKTHWGKLTKEDLVRIGDLDTFNGAIEQRYGEMKGQVSKWADRWYARWIGWYEGYEEPRSEEVEMESQSIKKIVINRSYGGFCVSHTAFLRLRELGQSDALQEPDLGVYWPIAATPREPSLNKCGTLIPRDDQKLVQVVEELRSAANGHCAELKIVEIPNNIEWKIEKAGGVEHVSEIHRTWS